MQTNTMTDPLMVRVFSVITPLMFIGITIPAVVSLSVALSTDHFHQPEPGAIEWIRTGLFRFQGIPADVTALIGQVFPALAAAICFRQDASGKKLSRSGKISFFILIIGFFVSLMGVSLIDPSSAAANEFVGGMVGLARLEAWSDSTLRICLTYLALLLGLQVNISQRSPKKGVADDAR